MAGTQPIFEFVDVTQNTDAWLRWRALGIGASEAPIIMGENRWKTAGELQQLKLNPSRRQYENEAMARGTALEPIARALYCDQRQKQAAPACVQNVERPWMRASIDGICRTSSTLVEIKCGESVYKYASRSRSVPDYYYGQLQHTLSVTGIEKIDFWCYLPEKKPVLIEVPRNDWYIKRLVKAETDFWKFIETDVRRAVDNTY